MTVVCACGLTHAGGRTHGGTGWKTPAYGAGHPTHGITRGLTPTNPPASLPSAKTITMAAKVAPVQTPSVARHCATSSDIWASSGSMPSNATMPRKRAAKSRVIVRP